MNILEEEIAFYYEIGLSLRQWAYVENQLCRVTVLCVPPFDRIALEAGYLSIENFRSKVQFSDAIIRKKFREATLISEWETLRDRLTTLSAKRNKIAHWKTELFLNNKTGRRYALVPWKEIEGSGRKRSKKSAVVKPPEGALCVKDIIESRNEFLALTRALGDFHAFMTGRPKPFRGHDEPSEKPPLNLQAIAARMRKALAKPSSPSKR